MKKQVYKIVSLIIAVIVVFGSVYMLPSQAAENDFSMKAFDKGYITFIFDDGRMPFTQECFDLFQEYDMPICCSIVANRAKSNLDLLLKIQESGGEILSHTYSHTALHSGNSTLENIERELGDGYRVLTGLGFNVNGVVETGNGGGEKTANYELIETVSRKYYKYSNAYGVSPQYNMGRTWLSGKTLNQAKSYVYDAITNKQWKVLWMHEFSEFSKADMRALLDYIDSRGNGKVEVVTWNYIYTKFGKYTGPQVPTQEAIKSVCTSQGHDLKNSVVYKEADCDNGPVMKGECKRCGEKDVTRQSETGALGHKFGEYVSDNNADCTNLSTKTAKCTVKGCTATDTVVDFDSTWKHNLKKVVVKEATETTDGLAEVKCTLCGHVEESIVIPKTGGGSTSSAPDNNTSTPTGNSSQGQNTNSKPSSSTNSKPSSNTTGNNQQNTNSKPSSNTTGNTTQQNTNSNPTSNSTGNNTQQGANSKPSTGTTGNNTQQNVTNNNSTSNTVGNNLQQGSNSNANSNTVGNNLQGENTNNNNVSNAVGNNVQDQNVNNNYVSNSIDVNVQNQDTNADVTSDAVDSTVQDQNATSNTVSDTLENTSQEQNTTNSTNASSKNKPAKISTGLIILLVVLSVFLLASVGFFVYFIRKFKS